MQPDTSVTTISGVSLLRAPSATPALNILAVIAIAIAALLMALPPGTDGRADSASSDGAIRGGSPPASQTRATGLGVSVPSSALAAISAQLGRDNSAFRATMANGVARLVDERQSLAATVAPSGARVTIKDLDVGLGAKSYGRGARMTVLPAGSITVSANRAEISRGDIAEWYVIGPAGLQQGFTIAQAPAGDDLSPVVIRLALGAGFSATVDSDRRGMTLIDRGPGRVVRYAGLAAFDATGRELPAWLVADDDSEIAIEVRDAGAAYPITVDPLFQNGELTASDGAAGDNLGFSVAISGDTIVAGAKGRDSGTAVDQGAAYVFVRPAAGWGSTSTYAARLSASDGAAGDRFGWSVAISGDTIVVGAPYHTVGMSLGQGAAYAFTRPAAGWSTMTETARLTASDGATDHNFGWSVAVDGDTIAVGAPNGNGAVAGQGAAYVYVRPGMGWGTTSTFAAKLTAADGAAGDFLDGSIAISGDTVVVGTPHHSVTPTNEEGSAYVFVRPAGGWGSGAPAQSRLTASGGIVGEWLGWSVAIGGGTVAAGAPGGNGGKGAAYVYVRSGMGWATTAAFTAKLTASDGATGNNFGQSVAVDVDTIVVGAPYSTVSARSNQGAAYAFAKPQAGWSNMTETSKLTSSDGVAGDIFGYSVAANGGAVVVGASQHDVSGRLDQGSAYVFTSQAPTYFVYLPFVAR